MYNFGAFECLKIKESNGKNICLGNMGTNLEPKRERLVRNMRTYYWEHKSTPLETWERIIGSTRTIWCENLPYTKCKKCDKFNKIQGSANLVVLTLCMSRITKLFGLIIKSNEHVYKQPKLVMVMKKMAFLLHNVSHSTSIWKLFQLWFYDCNYIAQWIIFYYL